MIIQGNSYRIGLRDESIHCCVTSFPYHGLRDYGLPPTVWGGDSNCQHIWGDAGKIIRQAPKRDHNGRDFGDTRNTEPARQGSTFNEATTGQLCQLCGAWLGCFGLEPTIGLHVANAVAVCREIKRVLRRDGVFWLNYGDSYATGKNGRSAADTKAAGKDDRTFRDKPFSVTELPAKNLCGIPWRVALALQDDGWILRSEIPWLKANAMPSSVTDRPGTAHEHVFMLVKSARYYYDNEAVRRVFADSRMGNPGNYKNGYSSGAGRNDSETKGKAWNVDKNITGRALRTSDPFFDSLDAYIAHLQDVRDNGGMLVDQEGLPAALVVNTASFKGAHYATFAPKLIAPLIKTTPEKVCPNCGGPWVRMKQPTPEYAANFGSNNGADSDRYGKGYKKHSKAVTAEYVTTGYQPTCKCGLPESDCVGAIILDPFVGSGTVIAVAKEHGRRGIGIDLSAEYLQTNALPRAERLTSQKSLAQLPMFSEAA